MSASMRQKIIRRIPGVSIVPRSTGYASIDERAAVRDWLAEYNTAAAQYGDPQLECIGGVYDPRGHRPEGVLAFVRSIDENPDGTRVALVLHAIHDGLKNCQTTRHPMGGYMVGNAYSNTYAEVDARCHPVVVCRELLPCEAEYFNKLPYRVTELAADEVEAYAYADCGAEEMRPSEELALNLRLAEAWIVSYNRLESGLQKPLKISMLATRDEEYQRWPSWEDEPKDRPVAIVSTGDGPRTNLVLKRSVPSEPSEGRPLHVFSDGPVSQVDTRGYCFVDITS